MRFTSVVRNKYSISGFLKIDITFKVELPSVTMVSIAGAIKLFEYIRVPVFSPLISVVRLVLIHFYLLHDAKKQ
jgi:hypothetical protein